METRLVVACDEDLSANAGDLVNQLSPSTASAGAGRSDEKRRSQTEILHVHVSDASLRGTAC